MTDSKRMQVKEFVQRKAYESMCRTIAQMQDRVVAESIRVNLGTLSQAIAWDVYSAYSFLELADIMEWKRSRVRR